MLLYGLQVRQVNCVYFVESMCPDKYGTVGWNFQSSRIKDLDHFSMVSHWPSNDLWKCMRGGYGASRKGISDFS